MKRVEETITANTMTDFCSDWESSGGVSWLLRRRATLKRLLGWPGRMSNPPSRSKSV